MTQPANGRKVGLVVAAVFLAAFIYREIPSGSSSSPAAPSPVTLDQQLKDAGLPPVHLPAMAGFALGVVKDTDRGIAAGNACASGSKAACAEYNTRLRNSEEMAGALGALGAGEEIRGSVTNGEVRRGWDNTAHTALQNARGDFGYAEQDRSTNPGAARSWQDRGDYNMRQFYDYRQR